MAALALSASFSLPALPGEMAFQDPRLGQEAQRNRVCRSTEVSKRLGQFGELPLADGRTVVAFQHRDNRKLYALLHGQQPMEESVDKDTTAIGHGCHDPDADCRARLVKALEKRLYPHSLLHPKELAFALGAHGRSVYRWLNGHGGISFEMIDAMVRFFGAQNDHLFIHEVFATSPRHVVPLAQVKAAREALEKIERGMP